jgi:hypothetical protein
LEAAAIRLLSRILLELSRRILRAHNNPPRVVPLERITAAMRRSPFRADRSLIYCRQVPGGEFDAFSRPAGPACVPLRRPSRVLRPRHRLRRPDQVHMQRNDDLFMQKKDPAQPDLKYATPSRK